MTTIYKLTLSANQVAVILRAIEDDIESILNDDQYEDEQKIWLVGEREILSVNIENQIRCQ